MTGSGQISGVSSSIAVTVAGTVANADMSLTLRATGYEDINIAGPVQNRTSFLGVMNGSGFVSQAITLTKH